MDKAFCHCLLRDEGLYNFFKLEFGLKVVSNKLRSYSAVQRYLISSVEHSTVQYETNRCEFSHQPTRKQERQIRKFKLQGQAQRFLICHGLVYNLFKLGGIDLKRRIM
jgi:transposase-like protein